MTPTRNRNQRRGAVLVVAMLLTAMLTLVLGSYYSLTRTSGLQTRRAFDRDAAFHLAEAGIEEAVWSYNRTIAGSENGWSDWSTNGSAAWRKFTDFKLTPGSNGYVKVYASTTNPTGTLHPLIVAESAVQTGDSSPVTQMIEVTLRRRSFFANGLTALRKLTLMGKSTFDSWNSDPDGNPATAPIDYSMFNRSDLGGIGSGATESSGLRIDRASIHGYLSTSGAVPVLSDGRIGPFGTLAGVIDPARLASDFNASFPVIAAPADGTWVDPVGATLGTPGETTRWRTPAIKLTGKETLTILGHVTLIVTAQPGTSAIDISGSASIIIPPGSSLNLHVDGNVKIAGRGLANNNIQPASFVLWGGNTSPDGQTIDITGQGTLKAVVYAPNGDLTLRGDAEMMGSIVARDITFTGNAAFHYDSSLSSLVDYAPFGPDTWRLLTSPQEKQEKSSLFQGW